MRLMILILSFLTFGCAERPVDPVPDLPRTHVYTPDLTNHVCAEYLLADPRNVIYFPVKDLPLEPGGPCDHMRGYERHDWKEIQNWERDRLAPQ